MSKFLIVDDNEQNLYMLRALLEGHGHEVVSAANGAEALETARPDPPDMIITDILMPVMDGFALCREWKDDQQLRDIPLVFYTATYTDARDEEFALGLGADKFIRKPQEPDTLMNIVQDVMNQGKADGRKPVLEDKAETFKLYSERLVNKLEKKMLDLEKEAADRKKMEQELVESNVLLKEALADVNQMQQQVIQQERLRALGQMASGIAHDFNNALASILGFSELLLASPESLDDKDKVRKYLEFIHTAGKGGAEVVSRLREFYRQREEGEGLAQVDLNAVVKEAISLTEPKWKHQAQANGVALAIEPELQDIADVYGNALELREVLTNLIMNAVDAMPEGGTITIRTRSHNEHVIIEVHDTGIGMTEDIREHCLEPFVTTKGEKGTGLGLAMVHGIIRRHSGTITIESAPGKGTCFTIDLPKYTSERAKADGTDELRPSGLLRVLVVDDELPVRVVLTEFLTADGHTAETAGSGAEALEKFKAGTFDLVITDRAMPGMSGDQLAAELKAAAPDVPIIMVTGFGQLMADTGQQPEHIDRVISKPVTQVQLRNAIVKVLGKGM